MKVLEHVIQTAAGGTLTVRLSPDAPAATVKAVAQMLKRARAGKPEPARARSPLWTPLPKIDFGAVILPYPGYGSEIEERRKSIEKEAEQRKRNQERIWWLEHLRARGLA
jgi:hypothetical protein